MGWNRGGLCACIECTVVTCLHSHWAFYCCRMDDMAQSWSRRRELPDTQLRLIVPAQGLPPLPPRPTSRTKRPGNLLPPRRHAFQRSGSDAGSDIGDEDTAARSRGSSEASSSNSGDEQQGRRSSRPSKSWEDRQRQLDSNWRERMPAMREEMVKLSPLLQHYRATDRDVLLGRIQQRVDSAGQLHRCCQLSETPLAWCLWRSGQ